MRIHKKGGQTEIVQPLSSTLEEAKWLCHCDDNNGLTASSSDRNSQDVTDKETTPCISKRSVKLVTPGRDENHENSGWALMGNAGMTRAEPHADSTT
jgi:hypothetical protein